MTANAARAVKATRELVNAVPFLGGSDSEDDYREALELVLIHLSTFWRAALQNMKTITKSLQSSTKPLQQCLLVWRYFAR
ncbi:hypothetical protein OGD51_000088 [Escherichia coli]|nr:hypothetical protein [Escherichia coli]HBN2935272.1 hypothetical protein [Escherichia coli O25b:H4-ST131]EHK0409790.1 hypothetical protein [Escherichia coli]EHM1985199.1 hypothetical protein [Escherichia coli]EHO2001294.1 hypothetical protein [Escherichia coli]